MILVDIRYSICFLYIIVIMYRIVVWMSIISSLIILSGCTSSKVDQFLAEADQQIALQQQSQSGTTTESENSSSQLFDQVVDPNQTSSQTASDRWTYSDYTLTTFEEARNWGKKIVLFFYNGWDSSSVNLDKAININLSRLPDNISIFKIDTLDKELTTFYKVQKPDTIIILDTNGNESKRAQWGIYKIEDLLYYL